MNTDEFARTDRRLERIGRHRAHLAARSQRLSTLRLIVFSATVVVGAVVGIRSGDLPGWSVVIAGLAAFAVLVRIHARIENARTRWDRWAELHRQRKARLDRDWDALGEAVDDPVDPGHPFAFDLDLVGPRSILRLIDTTVSLGGHRRLRDWLLRPEPDLAAVAIRQRRVAALIPARHLRMRLALTARLGLAGRRTRWDSESLLGAIGDEGEASSLRGRLIVLIVLAATTIAGLVGQVLAGWPPVWALSFLAYGAVTTSTLRRLAPLFDDALTLEEMIAPLRDVLGWLEQRPVPGEVEPVVTPLRQTDAHRPAAVLRHAQRVVWGAALRTSQLPWLIVNVVVPWDVYFAWRLDVVRAELRSHLPDWLDALHELEALGSLADFAELNPEHAFASFTEGEPVLEAEALGHPLLHPSQCVRNDLTVDRLGRVLLLTGSNMSGKSTFLRTLGLNVVLANAGSAVLARGLRLRPMRPFTCIRVDDSVNDGISYFYAEVKRLAALLEAHEAPSRLPQLSLIDEIYRGTNNRERWAGSRAFVEHLAGGQGLGVVSTHDLGLAALADRLGDVRNLHFREEVRDRRMEFDFVLREGPCPTTNALRLMAQEGLPVPEITD